MQVQELQKTLMASPFHRWLNLSITTIDDEGVELIMPWKEDLVSNVKLHAVHGGILASLIDLSGLYAIRARDVVVGATADLHVDYHRTATPGTLRVRSRVLKLGRRTSTAATEIFSEEGKLLASGRGLYIAIANDE